MWLIDNTSHVITGPFQQGVCCDKTVCVGVTNPALLLSLQAIVGASGFLVIFLTSIFTTPFYLKHR
jgi:hypothetical protein